MASSGKQNLGASVVPDLMRVYESLTQSKTPQVLPEGTNTANARTSATAESGGVHAGIGTEKNNGSTPDATMIANGPGTTSSASQSQSQQVQFKTIPLSSSSLSINNSHSNVAVGGGGGMENPFQFDPNIHVHTPIHSHLSSSAATATVTATDINFQSHQQSFIFPPTSATLNNPISGTHPAAHTSSNSVQPTSSKSNSTSSATASKSSRPRRGSTRKRASVTASDSDKNVSDGSDQGTRDRESKRKKKGGRGDARWSKRFAWPDELHRDFVSAVFDVGLKHSSPSAILEQMPKHEQITSERIKSHLQKYRLHRQKSKKEFMSSYSSTLIKMKAGEIDSDPSSLNSGEVAAHLSYTSIQEAEIFSSSSASTDTSLLLQGGVLQLPQLTDDEKRSPLGASLGYLMGLFFSLKQQLIAQRGTNGHVHGDEGASEHGQGNENGVHVVANLTSSNHSHNHHHHHPLALDSSQSSSNRLVQDQFSTSTTPVPISDSSDVLSPPQPSLPQDSAAAATSSKSYNYNSNNHSSHHQQSQQQQQSSILSQPLIPIQPHTHQDSSSNTTAEKSGSNNNSSMAPPDARVNNPVVEESKMMKREMASQMAFQNKMRKLKEQELNKYTLQAAGSATGTGNATGTATTTATGTASSAVLPSSDGNQGDNNNVNVKQDETTATASASAEHQESRTDATEDANANANMNDADFWTSGEMMDDQLFQFLMNE